MMIERMVKAAFYDEAGAVAILLKEPSTNMRAACASVRPEDVTDEMVLAFHNQMSREGLVDEADTIGIASARRAIAAAINAAGSKSPAG